MNRSPTAPLSLSVVVASACLVTSACTDLSLPDNPFVSCAANEECPTGLVCRTQLNRCIDPALLNQPVISFAEPLTLTRNVASRVAGFDEVEGRFVLTRAAKEVTLRLDDQTVGGCQADEDDALAFTCTFTLDELPDVSEGVHGVIVAVEDELANPARDEAAVRFDFTAPDVPPDTVWLRLRPGPGAVLRDVTALGSGARAELQFVVTEPLGPSAVVVARLGTESASFTRNDEGSIGLLELHELEVGVGAATDGAYDLEVTVEDPVGNVATVVLEDPVVIDSTPPAAPVNTPDVLSVERAPWGVDDSDGAPRFVVRGLAGAVEPGAYLIVRSGADPDSSELGRAQADSDGSVQVTLLPQDIARLYASVVDGAGNLGPASLVRGVVWRATLGRKVLGETFNNPHSMWRTTTLPDVRQPASAAEAEDASLTGSASGTIEVRSGTSWRRVPQFGTVGSGVLAGAAVYDRSGRRTLVFGGGVQPYQSPSSTFLQLVDGKWTAVDVADRPPARLGHAMVWDARNSRAVLFGGRQQGQFSVLGDTWVFDGVRWRQLDDLGAGPPSRQGHAMAWDPQRGVVVLFGGTDDTATPLGDTWELDGDVWTQRQLSTSPLARAGHALAYDDVAGKTVLFGGADGINDAAAAVFNDTWAFDGTVWTRLTPGTGSPSPRVDHTLVADEARGVLLMVGGRPTACSVVGFDECTDGINDALPDAWEWDGANWSPAPQTPRVALHSSVWDVELGHTLLLDGWYGTVDLGGAVGEPRMYELTPRRWVRRLNTAGLFLQEFATVYDGDNDVVVTHGGARNGGAAQGDVPETNLFDGDNWFLARNTAPPEGRSNHAMVFVPGVGSVILSALGTAEPTWRWIGASWQTLPASTNPQRGGEAMAYDSARDEIVLFGGCNASYCSGSNELSSTWVYTGADWVARTPASVPPARGQHAMAYDEARNVVVMFGGAVGNSYFGDTWEWDGTDWRDVTPTTGPSARMFHEMTWDQNGRRVLLYGGSDALGLVGDVWEWDGASWHELPTTQGAGPRDRFGFVWDPVEQRAVVFGGNDVTTVTASDMWMLEPGRESRAAIIARFLYSSSGAPAGLVPTSARVRVIAGGTSTTTDDAGVATKHPDVSLRVWQGGRWREFASAAHSDDAPGTLEATTTDVAQWLGGEGRPIHLAVTTTAAGGVTASDGTRPGVSVSYLELELDYTLP